MTLHTRRTAEGLAIFILLGFWLHGGSAHAQPSRQWAVLIAVQEHDEKKLTLNFTGNDVQRLRQTLVERAGILSERILEMTDQSAPGLRPTLANLRRELPRFLAKMNSGDRVLVFFSGHGMMHEGKTYLVPRDFVSKEPARTGLPAVEIRKALSDCQAQVKLLILDCCHAGGERAVERESATAEAVARGLDVKQVSGCVVLASCRVDEKSWEWAERQQGVFSYWLCRALEGGADKDGNGQLTTDEVYEYTHERVSKTVQQVFGRSQTPVRLIGGEVTGVPVVITLRPEPPETLCRRLAEHLDLEMRRNKLKKVGVLEFLTPRGRAEGLAHASLPSYCAERVRMALAGLAKNSYVVVGSDQLREIVKGVRVEDVGDPLVLRPLSQQGAGLDALITGTLRRRGQVLHVQCELVATANGSNLATPSGVLPLSEELVGDNGASFDNRLRPPGGPHTETVVNHVTQQAQQHPLLKPEFPFRVELWSILLKLKEAIGPNTPRKRKEFVQSPVAEGRKEEDRRELLVRARSDELFEIRVWNNSKQPVAMTLLVDGINTLGQRRERLGQAWSWLLQPTTDTKQPYTIEGWYLPRKGGAQAGQKDDFTLKRFQFVDVAQSVAGRQRFGESIGLITAAFYAEQGRALGVGEGPEEQRQLNTVNFKAGRLLGVVHIRYVDERDLDKLLDGK